MAREGLFILTDTGSEPAKGKYLIVPVQEGRVCHHILGGSLEASCANLADASGLTDAAPVGAPTVLPYGLGLKGLSNMLDTRFSGAAEMTAIVIARVADGQVVDASNNPRPVFAGSYFSAAGSPEGSYIGLTPNKAAPGINPPAQSNIEWTTVWPSPTLYKAISPVAVNMFDFNFYACVVRPTGQELYIPSIGPAATRIVGPATGARVLGTRPWRVGGAHVNFTGDNIGLEFILYHRGLSAAEIQALFVKRAEYWAARGIIITPPPA